MISSVVLKPLNIFFCQIFTRDDDDETKRQKSNLFSLLFLILGIISFITFFLQVSVYIFTFFFHLEKCIITQLGEFIKHLCDMLLSRVALLVTGLLAVSFLDLNQRCLLPLASSYTPREGTLASFLLPTFSPDLKCSWNQRERRVFDLIQWLEVKAGVLEMESRGAVDTCLGI